ncbi:hypothetical protein AGOR_G00208470 [Albula goreensis]|uniref:Immunoglobulin V-set domain-containing protein n=1 Tax=Albula goreensis TaxID=1534307 RepID=A0A8T3CTA5_9TELE|nr:hypothetical protein AGOR_G00208470 [Albula goreensis]
MISLVVCLLSIFTIYQTAECLDGPVSLVSGTIGKNVTIQSRVNSIPNAYAHYSWYRQWPGGKVERIAYFSTYSQQFRRYTGKVDTDSNNLHLTLSDAELADSGRYFGVMHTGDSVTPGIATDLAVTDPRRVPVMRVFRSGAGTFLCELKGAGTQWSDPQWKTEDEEGKRELPQPDVEKFVNEHGDFIQSSILSLEDEIPDLICFSRHETGLIIQTRIKQHSSLESKCSVMLYIGPLSAVLLLVTVITGGLWAWRQKRQA